MKRAQDGEGRAVVALYPNGFQALERVEGEVKLPLMYDRLNCTLVEVVRLSPMVEMWVDEEGLITGRPVNALATAPLAPVRRRLHLLGLAMNWSTSKRVT